MLIDHRNLTKSLELYYFDNKLGQGLPIFLSNYSFIRNEIQQFIRKKWIDYNFIEVITPVIGEENLYKVSKHLEHYKEAMFSPSINQNEIFYLRPMTCPHHCLIFQKQPRTYKELPLRISENSILFRYETSGSLKGLERIRYFELCDHHIFVDYYNLKQELKNNFYFVKEILKTLEFNIDRIICSLHDNNDNKYHLDEELWNKSEIILQEILNEMQVSYYIQKGEAAFYGPKIDFEVKTVDDKYITISTIQLDFLLPKQFNLSYFDKNQKIQSPILIHQTPIGSYQRFIALMLEKRLGKLPFCLNICQIAILTLNESIEIINYCKKLVNLLIPFRTQIFIKKSLNYRIREIYKKKIPYFIIIGNSEVKTKIIKLTYTYENLIKEISEFDLKNNFKNEF